MPHLKALEGVRASGTGVLFSLKYSFASDIGEHRDLTLVVERPGGFRIAVNGRSVTHDPADGYWVDTTFRRIPISALVRPGVNEIILEGLSAQDSEIEACYLVGDFGVQQGYGGFRLVPAPRQVRSGDLGPQGLPFYAGRVRLSQQAPSLQ